jgi:hypothetical protein
VALLAIQRAEGESINETKLPRGGQQKDDCCERSRGNTRPSPITSGAVQACGLSQKTSS